MVKGYTGLLIYIVTTHKHTVYLPTYNYYATVISINDVIPHKW